MNFSELNQEARELQDRIEQMNLNIAWLKRDTEKQFPKVNEQPAIQPSAPPTNNSQQLTPDQIKRQFELHGEQFLDETIADLGKLYPSQLYENPTQKLPSPPPPSLHEVILKMVKKNDPIDGILLRLQGEE